MQRHAYDPISLVCGVLLAAAGGLLVAGRLDVFTQASWLLPALLIAVALAMFGAAAWSLRRPHDRDRPPSPGSD